MPLHYNRYKPLWTLGQEDELMSCHLKNYLARDPGYFGIRCLAQEPWSPLITPMSLNTITHHLYDYFHFLNFINFCSHMLSPIYLVDFFNWKKEKEKYNGI